MRIASPSPRRRTPARTRKPITPDDSKGIASHGGPFPLEAGKTRRPARRTKLPRRTPQNDAVDPPSLPAADATPDGRHAGDTPEPDAGRLKLITADSPKPTTLEFFFSASTSILRGAFAHGSRRSRITTGLIWSTIADAWALAAATAQAGKPVLRGVPLGASGYPDPRAAAGLTRLDDPQSHGEETVAMPRREASARISRRSSSRGSFFIHSIALSYQRRAISRSPRCQ